MEQILREFGTLTRQEREVEKIIDMQNYIDDCICIGMSCYHINNKCIEEKNNLLNIYYKPQLEKFIYKRNFLNEIRTSLGSKIIPVEIQDIILGYIKIIELGCIF